MLLFAITYAHTNIFEITSVWKKIELSLEGKYGVCVGGEDMEMHTITCYS